MKKLFLFTFIALVGLFGGRCSCNDPVSSSGEKTGAVSALIVVEKIGGLAKAQAINLAKAYVEISAEGETTLKDSFDLSGSEEQTKKKIFSDIKVKQWKAKAWTKDQIGTVIHSDSVNFTVRENDTVDVSLNLSAKFSMLTATYAPISDSATSCELWVNGVKVADSIFGQNSGLSQVRLNFDYLPASPSPGTPATVEMKIYGKWAGESALLWTGSMVINVISSQDINQTVSLAWVGPQVGGVDIEIVIGRIGTVTAEGNVQPRPNTSP